MISLSTFRRIDNVRDGAVMEYSTDDGNTWKIIGAVNGGINWYNGSNITVRPGSDQVHGWTDTTQNWVVSRYDLDQEGLLGEKNVRFRIAFESDGAISYDGFAFDNIQIRNRTRRVLMEHFSNYESPASYTSDATIDLIRETKPQDAIDILYESSLSVDNYFYNKYSLGVNAREAYYNITSVPYTYFDGLYSYNYQGDNKPNDVALISKALIDPAFQIDLTVEGTGSGLAINTQLTALEEITNRQLQLFTAIVEKDVSYNPGTGMLTFQNVLRRFVPSPSGEYINKSWSIGDDKEYNYTYTLNSYIENPANLIVVTFVQDELTKEILQTVTSDTTLNPAVSIQDWFANTKNLDMLIFPNPTHSEAYLVLSETPTNNSFVEILNQQGKVIQRVNPLSEQQVKIETHSLVQGIYFVRWVNNDRQVVKKLVVVH